MNKTFPAAVIAASIISFASPVISSEPNNSNMNTAPTIMGKSIPNEMINDAVSLLGKEPQKPISAANKDGIYNLSIEDFNPDEYIQGTHYLSMGGVMPPPLHGKEIIKFFWYGCSHCYEMEKKFKPYEARYKEAEIPVIYMPAVAGEKWVFLARVFYTAQDLNVLDKVHNKIFVGIHDKKSLKTAQDILDIFNEAGVTKEAFIESIESKRVTRAVMLAADMSKGMDIRSVPQFVINREYKTSISMAGGYDKAFKLALHLAANKNRDPKFSFDDIEQASKDDAPVENHAPVSKK